jgi:hypothetical protein
MRSHRALSRILRVILAASFMALPVALAGCSFEPEVKVSADTRKKLSGEAPPSPDAPPGKNKPSKSDGTIKSRLGQRGAD